MFRLHLLQAELHWEDPAANRDHFFKMIDPLAGESDLIVLPEMFSSGFTMQPAHVAEPMDGPTMQWMRRMAQRSGSVIAGSLVIERNGRYYNRLIWMGPDGEFRDYDKRHLFRLAGEHNHYDGGTHRYVFEWKGWRIFPLICYDLRFPVWSRRTPAFDFDLLVYVANWPERRALAWQRLLPARAIENQCFVAGLNRTGLDGNGISHRDDSVILDYTGETVAAGQPGEEGLVAATLELEKLKAFRNDFTFWQDADGFELK